MIELCLVNANNYLKIPERRFLNATLVYFKMRIANVRYCNLPWRRSDENDQVYHGWSALLLSICVLSTVLMYVCSKWPRANHLLWGWLNKQNQTISSLVHLVQNSAKNISPLWVLLHIFTFVLWLCVDLLLRIVDTLYYVTVARMLHQREAVVANELFRRVRK